MIDDGEVEVLGQAPEGRSWWPLVVAVVVGIALGVAGAHLLGEPSGQAAAPGVPLRVSLGAHAGDVTGLDGNPVVAVPLIMDNLTDGPLKLLEIRVTGPGAKLIRDPEKRPSLPLPVTLAPGARLDGQITILSDCSVSIRPAPVITFVVADEAGQVHEVTPDIPGVASVWGRTLVPLSCPDADGGP